MSRFPRCERIDPPPSGLDRKALGRWGEDQVLRLLVDHGYELLARNLEVAGIELDLVLTRRRTVLVVEVKTGRSAPEVNLSPSQRQRLMFAASKLPKSFPGTFSRAGLLLPGLRSRTSVRVDVKLAALQLGDPATVRFFELD